MLRRANSLVSRARERIRAASEHDPHDPRHWYHDEDGWHPTSPAAYQDVPDEDAHVPDDLEDADGADDRPLADIADADDRRPGCAPAPPLGSPEPGAPDLTGAVGLRGVSGPPPRTTPESGRRTERRRGPRRSEERLVRSPDGIPTGLRTAASWAWRLVVVVAAFYAVLWLAAYMAVVVAPVLVALLLAALFQPGAAALVRRGWPRALAAFTMLIVGLGVVTGIITLVVNQFAAGFPDLANQVSEGLGRIQSFIVRTLPITRGQLDEALQEIQKRFVENQDNLATGALTTAATVGEIITGAILALFTLFFFLKDGRSIWLWMVGLFPRDARAYVDEAARRSWRTLISYVRATVVVALVDAIGIGIGLAVLRTPLVIPLAALVFLGAFIPIIGSFLAGSVAVLVSLVSQGPVQALIALAIVVGVMQLEGHVLQPLLLGRAVRVHPLAVVLAIAAGLLIAGIFGALIAVPMVACANVAGTYLSRRHLGPRPPEPRPERAIPPVGAR
jgi:predicted PurR-regulated permease PerM